MKADVNKAAINTKESNFNKSLLAAANVVESLTDFFDWSLVRKDTLVFFVEALTVYMRVLRADCETCDTVDTNEMKSVRELIEEFTLLIQQRSPVTI